jgi:hypothetical protein
LSHSTSSHGWQSSKAVHISWLDVTENSNHWLQTVIKFSDSVVMFGKLIAYIHDMKASHNAKQIQQ